MVAAGPTPVSLNPSPFQPTRNRSGLKYCAKLTPWSGSRDRLPAADRTSAQLIARRDGNGIAMEGKLFNGTPVRWRYLAVAPASFHYVAERLQSDGKSWQLYLELFGTRSARES